MGKLIGTVKGAAYGTQLAAINFKRALASIVAFLLAIPTALFTILEKISIPLATIIVVDVMVSSEIYDKSASLTDKIFAFTKFNEAGIGVFIIAVAIGIAIGFVSHFVISTIRINVFYWPGINALDYVIDSKDNIRHIENTKLSKANIMSKYGSENRYNQKVMDDFKKNNKNFIER